MPTRQNLPHTGTVHLCGWQQSEASNLRWGLNWFIQPGGIILPRSTNLTAWTEWVPDATGTAESVSFVPLANRAFFRLMPPGQAARQRQLCPG